MSFRHAVTRKAVRRGAIGLWIVLALLPFVAHRGGKAKAQALPSTTLTFNSTADTYVDSGSPTKNFNSSVILRAAASPTRVTYLRFAVTGVSGRQVQKARLRLGVSTGAASGGTVHLISNNTWSETAVTFNTRPTVDGPGLQTLGAVTTGATVEFTLDGAITGDGTYNLAIDSSNAATVSYNSALATSGQKPQLVLTVVAQAPTVTIAQPPTGASFFTGDAITLQGSARDSAGVDLSTHVTWSSNLAGPLGTGAVVTTSLGQGTHTITASVTDGQGITGSSQISVTVTPPPPGNTPPLVTITAPTSGQTLASSATISFTGSASDLEDGDLSAAISWTSDRDGALGTGGTVTHMLSEGTHQITATIADRGGLTATATVTVQVVTGVVLEFPAVADASVDEALPTTNFGTSPILAVDTHLVRSTYLRFNVTGLATRTILGAVLRMQVDGTSGSESNSGGVLHTITDGTWQENTLTFNNRPPVDGPTVASQGPVALGQTVDFNAAAAVNGDGTYNFAIVSTSADECDYRSREGGPAPKLVVTVQGNPPSVTISSPVNGSVHFRNDTIAFAAQANDAHDGDLSSQIQWTSSRDGALGTGAAINASTLSVGTHVITAAATDADGLRGQAVVSIRVRDPNVAPVVTISAPADGASVPAGTTVTLAATATDDFDGNVTSKIQWASSRDGALGGGGTRTVTLSAGSHVLVASVTDSDGATGSAQVHLTVTPTPPVVTITGPPDGTTAFVGTSLAFSGTANDATDGNLSASLRWISDRDGLIGSGASFTTTRLSAGTHVITASATDRGGLTGQAQRTIVVRPPNTPPTVSIAAPVNGTALITGTPVLLAATATDAEDGDLAAAVRWTSSRDGALGTGGVLVVPSLSVGSHTLTASATDRDGAMTTATVTVNVVPATLTFAAVADTYVDASKATTAFGTATSIAALSSPAKIAFLRFAVSGVANLKVQQAKLRLTAVSASNSGGVLKSLTNNTWSEASTNYNTRPTVDGPMLATQGSVAAKQVVDLDVTSAVTGDASYNFALSSTSSTAAVYNSREAASGQPQLILTLGENQAPFVRITAPPSGSQVLPGAAVTFLGTATDAENGNLSSQIQWSSSLDGALGTGASLTVSSLRSGLHTITARVADAGGLIAQAQITLTVLSPPVVRITAPADGAAFFAADGPITFSGTATDVEEGILSRRLQWSSDRDGALASGATITASQLSIGTHTITAMAINDNGLHGQASISIRVRGPNQPPQITITSPADGTSVPAGTSTALTATVTDDFDTNLAGQVRWTSSRDGALGTGPRAVTLSEGSHILTAAVSDSNGASASAQVHVTIAPSPPVVTITAPAAGTRVFAGTNLTFSGTAIDATDGNLTAGLRWTSDRDGAIGSGPSFSTSRLSIGTHTITAAATDRGGLAGQTQLTLIIRGPNVPPAVQIVKPADGGSLLGGKPVLLEAMATDVEDGDLGAGVKWTSSLDGALGTGGLLVVPSLSLGTHTLTAVVTDGDGATGTASITVAVRPPTMTVAAAADTYVSASAATTKFGTATSLSVASSPVNQAFLRFNVSGIGSLAVQSAHLKLTAGSTTASASTSGGALYSISDNTWSEATTTYNNRPAVDGPTLGTQGAVAIKQVVDFDVTTTVRGDGAYNFGLVTTASHGVIYNSREASSGQPQLVVTLAQNQSPAITITAPASGTKVRPGDPVTFTGRALDAENGDLSSQIQWRSDVDGVLGTGASLTISTLSPGLHTITARVVDATGLSAEVQIMILVAHPPMVGIASPPDGSVYFLTDLPVTLTGVANDVEDGDLSAKIQWSSSLAGPLGTGSTVSAGSLAIGTHTITATVTDADGLESQAQIAIRVRGPNAPPQITIAAPRDGAAVPAGTNVTLGATATDDFDGDLSGQVQWTSSRDGALFRGASRSILLSEGSHVLTASITDSDGATASAQVHVTITPTPPVVTITAPPGSTRVFAGTSVTFTATAIDATDGNVGATLRWISNLDGPIGTSPTFSTTRLSAGTHTIAAIANDTGGLLGRAQTTVVIRPPNNAPVVTIVAPSDQASLLVGKPVVLGATALDAEDGDLSPTIRWTSSRDGILGTGPTVLRPSLSAGTHTITATVTDLDGATGTASITVNVVPATMTLTPIADTYVDSGAATKPYGTATTMQAASSPVRQAFLRFQVTGVAPLKVQQALVRLTVGPNSADGSLVGGTLRTITNGTWSEATTTYNTRPAVDGAILTTKAKVLPKQVVDFDATSAVTGDGTYNFALVSSSTDWVTYQTREATSGKPQLVLTLAQNTPPVVNIAAPAPNSTVNIGAPVSFKGTATDAESGDLSSQIQWTSNLDGALGTGATLIVARLQPGTHVITARVTDPTGLSGQARITLNVGHKPTVTITSPLNRSVFYLSQGPVTFTGTANDFEDGNLSGRMRWTSDRDGSLGTGSSVTRSLTLGTHTITATVTDVNGNVGQAQIIVKVRGPNVAPALTITAPQDNSSAPADTDVTLTATAIDDFDGDISSQVQWTSSRQGALFNGASKAVRLREGQHTITASVTDSDGATSTAQITVIITPTPPAVTITSPAAGSTVTQDASTSFNATALDATDGDLSSTIQWSSDRDGVLATGASFAANMLSVGTHHITAAATDTGGLVGTASVTLIVIRVPAVAILLPQANDGYLTGNVVTFYATATDRVDGDVASSLVWTSDRDGQIGTGTTFTTSSLSSGAHTITAKATNSGGNATSAQVSIVVHVATLSFDPIADTYVDQLFPTTAFGAANELDVGSTSPTQKNSFLRFAVAGIGTFPVLDAKLQLSVLSIPTADGGAAGQVNSISNTTWSEGSTTWNKQPSIDGPVLGANLFPVVQGQHIEIDLGATSVKTDGTYNFALTSPSSNAAKYESRESSTVANRPHLVLLLGQPATRRLPQVAITAPATGTSVFDNQSVTFTATARDDRDGDLTSAISWRSSIDGALGTGGSVTAATLHRGTHTITATVRNSTGLTGVATVQLTVTNRPPAVTITAPQDGRLFPVHFAATFTATATDNIDGDIGSSLVWTSDRDGRLGTGRSITTSTLSTGDHRITASVPNSLGTIGSASITVTVGNGAPKVTISTPSDGTSVDEGTTVALKATATDPEDGDLTSSIAWASDLQGALGTGGTVSFQFTVPGTHHVTATVADSGGQTRAASITLTVNKAAPVLTIVAPADGFSTSGAVTFSGTAIDFKDGDRSSAIRWSSDVAGSLGTGATVTAPRLASGRHVITASVTDSDNLTATKTITIGVGNAPPQVTITQPADGATAAAGTALTLQATAQDGIDGNLTARIQWVSDLNGPIGTGGSITTSTLARGTHVITAQAVDSGGLTGSSFVIVTITPGSTANNRPPQVTITAPGSGAQLPVGSAVTFTGTAIDEAGDLSANLAWVSSLDGVIGTGRSFTTSTLSAGTHRIVASVSDSAGLVGNATIAVTVSGGGITFPVVADAYTDGNTANQTTNFGTAPILRLWNQPVQRVFLRFTVSGLPPGPVARAIVRMTTTSAVNAGSDSGGEIHTVSAPWDELTVNHLNKPTPDPAILSSVAGPIVPSQTYDYDVSAAVTGNGTYDFVLKTLSTDRAEFVSREGGTGAPQLIVFRDAPTATQPTVHITSPADGTMVGQSVSTTFTATATDPQDGNIASSLTWRSDRDGVLGTGPSVTATLSVGTHVITATARDSAGTVGADLIHVAAGSGAPVVNIAAPANTGNAVFGQPVAFIGSATDMPDGDLSFNLQWTSSIDGPIGTGPSFITRLSAGTHTITASVTDSNHNAGSTSINFQVTATRVGYEDFSYGPNLEINLDKATAMKPQSKLWFNDGIWWSVLYNVGKSEYHIYRMDLSTQTWIDTGVAVDNRGKSRADCLWDGQNQKLYVASRYSWDVSPPANRLYRYTYFPGAQTYALDAGFPINIAGNGESVTIAKDSTGTLWIAGTSTGQVLVNHTIGGDDTNWSAPYFLPATEGNPATPGDDAAVEWLPGNPGKIGVLWGNQSTQKYYFMVHGDGTPPEDPNSWKFEIAASGSNTADDHMNMKVASDGRVFATVKTSRTVPGQTLVGLLVRSVDGTWSPLIKVTNTDFDPTRPNVVLDEVNRKVYVFYASFFSDVYYKAADMDAPVFTDTGVGTPLMVSGTHPVSPSIGGPGGINNVTTTKQVLDPSNGILVLASTTETDKYWHGWIEYPKPVPVVTITAPTTTKVRAGSAVTFTGTATSGTDGVISPSIQWTSSRDGQIGAGITFSTSALSAGVHTITASATDSSKLTGSAQVTVTVEADAPPVVTITSPNRGDKFRPGQQATFTGTAIDSIDGNRTANMVWTSSLDGQIGTGGSFTRSNLSLGHHTITARAADLGSLTGSASITIDVANVSAPVLTLTAPVDGRKFAFGAPIPFAATATDSFDGDISARIAWTSDHDGAIGTGGSFNRATLSRATHTITASITDTAGLSASATTHVIVLDDAPPVVTISAPTRTLFPDGKPITFTATAIDQIDGDRTSTLTWTSNRDGAIGTGGSFTTSSLSIGQHVITASATDANGLVGTAQLNLEVRHQGTPAVTITAPADNSEAFVGQTVTLTGTASDTIDGDLGAAINWTSDRDGALGTGATLSTARLSFGPQTITASATNSGHLTGTAQIHLSVVNGPQIVILGPPDMTLVALGDPITFSGLAFHAEDGDLSSRLSWTSSRDGLLGTGSTITVNSLSRGVHTITVSVTDNHNHTATVQLAVEVVARPTVLIGTPATGALYKFGDTVNFVGFASDPVDGTLTGSMSWTSSIDGALGTGGSISVTTLHSGTHTITASATNRRGLTGQKQITIVVNDPPVVTITAPADGAKPVQGTPVTLSASATDREDGNLSGAVAWTSSRDGVLGTGGSLTLSTLSAGVHTLTASVTDSGGRSASASRTITVSGRPAVTITTPLSGARFNQADTISFTAGATDPEDGDVSSSVTWTSDRDGALGTGATITHTLSAGTHTITARATDRDGNSGQAQVTITVNSPPTVTISTPADHADFGHATPVTLRATASDPEDGTLTPVIAWTSSRDGALGTGGTIITSALSSGTHVITATVADSGRSTASASITITVNGAPVVNITAPTSGVSYLPGTPVSFTATATDFEDGDLTAGLRWTSNRDGALGTGGSITANALSAGIHTITASVSDSSGKPGSMQIVVIINTPPVVTITAPPAGTSPEPLAPVTFTATATDAEDGNLASTITWTSSRDGALGTGGTITTSGLSSGTHTITASVTDSVGKTSTAQMTLRVNATPRITITAPAPGTSPEPHAPVTFTATALDAEDGDLSAGITWTSSRDGTLGTGGTITTSTLSTGTHTIRAAVTDSSGKQATATMTVVVNTTPTVHILTPADGSQFERVPTTFTGTASDPEDGDISSTIDWASNRDGHLGSGVTIIASLSSGTHVITASVTDSGGKRGTATITIVVNATPTVTITAPTTGSTYEHGAPITFTGTAIDPEDGNLTGSMTWTSDRDGALGTGFTVSTAALSSGTHTITASATDSGNKTGRASITVVVNSTPTVIIGSPATGATFDPGAPVTLSAAASDLEDGNLSAVIVWSSSRDGAIGAGSTITTGTLSTGTHVLTASATDHGGKTGHASITITINTTPVVTITAPANNATYEPGAAVTLTGTATDVEDGSLTTGIVWTSSRDGRLGSGSTITTSTLTSGTHTITATATDSGGKAGRASITIVVNATPAVMISAPANGATFEPGAAVTFTGTASDLEDGDLTTHIAWTSSRDGALGTGHTITASALSTGTHTITASVTDSGGKTGSTMITITVNATPVVTISAPAQNATFEPGAAATFTGSATDAEDGTLTSRIVWTSNRDGVLGTGGTITVSTLSNGIHTITAAATDSTNKTGRATITISINATPVVAITAPATGTNIEPGAAATFTATATDAEDGNLASAIIWTSSRDGLLGTGASITTSTLSTGTHIIAASATDTGGKSGRATITVTVNATPRIAITAPTSGSVYEPGTSVTFTATATDTEDGNLTSHISWISSRDGVLGTGGSITTSTLSSGTHAIIASVTDSGGRSASVAISVVVNATPTVAITAPASGSILEVGTPTTLTATASDPEDGNIASRISWTSSRDGALGTGGSITLSTLSSGTHVITAAATDSGGKTGRASITITMNATPTVTITAPTTGSAFQPGAAVTLTATATDLEDGNLGSRIAWTSSRDGALGTGASLTVSTLSTGTHTITASATDSLGKTGHASITVLVDATPTVSISTPLTSAVFVQGETITFAATATDTEEGTLTSGITWQSNRDGALSGTGGTITTSSLSAGTHTITASVTDAAGRTGSSAILVVVDVKPTVTISAPTTTAYNQGDTITFAATASDPEDGDLTAHLVWAEGATTLATGAGFSTSTLAPGSHTISVSATDSAGKTTQQSVTVTVDGNPTVTITAPTTTTYNVGDTVSFAATASDHEAGDLTGSIAWSDGTNTFGTGANASEVFNTAGDYTITASVTDTASKTATASITIHVVTP